MPPVKGAAPPLPATAAEVTDQVTFTRVVTALTSAITKAVSEGKTVTSGNKRLITCAAEEIRRAVHALATISPPAPPGPSELITTEENGLGQIKQQLVACVREEMKKLKAELSIGAQRAQNPAAEPSRSYAQALGSRPARGSEASPPTRPPPSQHVTKPALIVAAKNPAKTRQDVVAAWRKSISFKDCKYAPLQIKPTSGNKLRVEFETSAQRDETLNRLSGSREVSAEPARSLHPMVIVKGVDKETPVEELSGIIRRQNPSLEGLGESDLTLKFQRNNRNPSLYNAVFIAKNNMFKALTAIGRVCVDHQRIHVEEFSPFIQCHCCLQFGHVRKNCPTQEVLCAFCADSGHAEADCPVKKLDGTAARCYNCAKRNSKFDLNSDTKHNATSTSCPVLRAMKSRVDKRIDYGSVH